MPTVIILSNDQATALQLALINYAAAVAHRAAQATTPHRMLRPLAIAADHIAAIRQQLDAADAGDTSAIAFAIGLAHGQQSRAAKSPLFSAPAVTATELATVASLEAMAARLDLKLGSKPRRRAKTVTPHHGAGKAGRATHAPD